MILGERGNIGWYTIIILDLQENQLLTNGYDEALLGAYNKGWDFIENARSRQVYLSCLGVFDLEKDVVAADNCCCLRFFCLKSMMFAYTRMKQ